MRYYFMYVRMTAVQTTVNTKSWSESETTGTLIHF